MKWIVNVGCLVLLVSLSACTDAYVVSGKYSGTVYGADTVPGTVLITEVNESFVRINTSWNSNAEFVDYAQMTKNGDLAYSFSYQDDVTFFSGYYYEGFLLITSGSNQFTFEGNQD